MNSPWFHHIAFTISYKLRLKLFQAVSIYFFRNDEKKLNLNYVSYWYCGPAKVRLEIPLHKYLQITSIWTFNTSSQFISNEL